MNFKKKFFLILPILLLVVSSPLVFAIDIDTDVDWQFLEDTFEELWLLLQNQYVRFGLTFILFFILLYGIFSAVLKKMKIFEGQTGVGINRSGQLVCIAMSGLASLAIIYANEEGDIDNFLTNVLGPFGLFGGIFIALIIFFGIRTGFKDEEIFGMDRNLVSAIAAALALLFVAPLINSSQAYALGWLVAIAAIFFGVFRFLWGRGPSSTSGTIDRAERDAEQELQELIDEEQQKPRMEDEDRAFDRIRDDLARRGREGQDLARDEARAADRIEQIAEKPDATVEHILPEERRIERDLAREISDLREGVPKAVQAKDLARRGVQEEEKIVRDEERGARKKRKVTKWLKKGESWWKKQARKYKREEALFHKIKLEKGREITQDERQIFRMQRKIEYLDRRIIKEDKRQVDMLRSLHAAAKGGDADGFRNALRRLKKAEFMKLKLYQGRKEMMDAIAHIEADKLTDRRLVNELNEKLKKYLQGEIKQLSALYSDSKRTISRK